MPDGFLKYTTKAFPNSLSSNPSSVVVLVRSLALSQNCEKRLLASSCLSVCMSVRWSAWKNSGPTGQIFLKLDAEYYSKTCREYSSCIKICQESHLIHMKTNVHFLTYLAEFFLE